MIVLIHVFIALSSVAYTTYLTFKPSRNKLKVSYGLVAATLISGTYLVVSTNAAMLQACMTGLIYIGVVSAGISWAHYRLATAENSVHKTD